MDCFNYKVDLNNIVTIHFNAVVIGNKYETTCYKIEEVQFLLEAVYYNLVISYSVIVTVISMIETINTVLVPHSVYVVHVASMSD